METKKKNENKNENVKNVSNLVATTKGQHENQVVKLINLFIRSHMHSVSPTIRIQ